MPWGGSAFRGRRCIRSNVAALPRAFRPRGNIVTLPRHADMSLRAMSGDSPRTCPERTRPSGSPRLRAGGCGDLVEGLGVLERREVARVAAEHLRAHCAADDLGAARLR